ncbi:MAG: sigma-70 family RNA polymerase sigma factor [Actinobacteria bacterium]|nr:sigma-70 family RNA polymerase sigma factor [Actinomycetota bacterium]
MEDAELIRQARDGDIRAYEVLVERYREVAFRTAYLITRNAADAEDAAQDAFVKAYYALDRFRMRSDFRPWILRIASNEAKNRRRSARRREGLALRLAEGRPSGDAAPSPEAAALDRELREALLGALGSLREGDRLVIGYRYFLDLSEAEMADVLGVRRGTVKSRLSRALGRLRAALPDSVAADPASEGRLEAADG